MAPGCPNVRDKLPGDTGKICPYVNTTIRGYPAKRALSAMRKHDG